MNQNQRAGFNLDVEEREKNCGRIEEEKKRWGVENVHFILETDPKVYSPLFIYFLNLFLMFSTFKFKFSIPVPN